MRQIGALLMATTLLVLGPSAAGAGNEPDGFWTTPAIAGYGRVHPLPQAAYKPDPGQTYRVVFSLIAAAKTPDAINPGLDRVARTVNLYVASGVPLSHLKFVVVVTGPATSLALNDAQYKAANGVANPNLPLIASLRKAGVDVAVCGQAVAEHGFQYEWVDPSVTLALSAVTTITTLEHQGYTLLPL